MLWGFMTKVPFAEDDLLIADMLRDVMIGEGYEVCGIARTFDEAIAIGEREKPTLAVLDLRISAATCSRCADHRVGCGEMSGGTRRGWASCCG